MNILHVNSTDLRGRRFNGYDLIGDLGALGHSVHQCVVEKHSDNCRVINILPDRHDYRFHEDLRLFEQQKSWLNLIYPWAHLLKDKPEFKNADIVHYHLLHTNVVSLLDLPWLFSLKPSIWTLHDPWMFTGHCIHPIDCQHWKEGCKNCPDLNRALSIQDDNASLLWKIKQQTIAKCKKFYPVVASSWMKQLYGQSPIFEKSLQPEIIPFGVAACEKIISKASARAELGINQADFVIFFRQIPGHYKGLSSIIDALKSAKLENVSLITVDRRGLLGELRNNYSIKEYGWVNNTHKLNMFFAACDVFLMPSEAEAFGLMAVEAMLASRPVICAEGTALPSVTNAPEIGIAVPPNNPTALRKAIKHLCDNRQECEVRGEAGRRFAKEHYCHSTYLKQLISHYQYAIQDFYN